MPLFTVFAAAALAFVPIRGFFATISYAPAPLMFPLVTDKVSFYLIMVIITSSIFLTFWILLFNNKLEAECDKLFDQTVGKLTIVPLSIAWVYALVTLPMPMSFEGVTISCLILSLIGFIMCIVIEALEEKVNVSRFPPFVIRKAFISCLTFLHFYVFISSICLLALFNASSGRQTKVIEDSQIGVIFFAIIFLCLWGGFKKDQVICLLTLLWMIGMMVNSARGKDVCTKKFRNGTIAITSIALLPSLLLLFSGPLLCKQFGSENVWPLSK